MRMYGVHVALAISLLINLGLFLSRPDPKKNVGQQIKNDFNIFARQVTQHLLDSSYITVEQNTAALLSGELAPSVIAQLKQGGLLPNTLDEMRAQSRAAADERRVTAVRIDNVSLGDPNQNGLIPAEVSGAVAIHSASGSEDPKPFKFKYLLGQTKKGEELKPIVAGFSG